MLCLFQPEFDPPFSLFLIFYYLTISIPSLYLLYRIYLLLSWFPLFLTVINEHVIIIIDFRAPLFIPSLISAPLSKNAWFCDSRFVFVYYVAMVTVYIYIFIYVCILSCFLLSFFPFQLSLPANIDSKIEKASSISTRKLQKNISA